MDAFQLVPMEHADAFWVGRLSACIGEASERTTEKHVRDDLRDCLAQFIASPVPSEELRRLLRPYLVRGAKK
jgi:hypothetical protein